MYTALYRKFRPASFEDVKGQDAIVTTLKNQIKAGRIGHAYLFCGTRGTGKTTIAKIFAKAVNCEQPIGGNPCGHCPSCQSIQEGSSLNVIEIDAASNNGVDNIREIREEVAYRPSTGKYKVYIIDEVHMLSIGAFNALLKTLEEPPSYVIFLLATTEVNKVPVTILSRCQRYDLRRITIEAIKKRLREIVEIEEVEAQDKALRYIAKSADGSMRDALSLLDQCIAFYLGKELGYDEVLDVLGAVDMDVLGRLLRKILAQDVAGTLAFFEELLMMGRDSGQLVTDFTWYLRNLLLAQSSDDMEEMLDVSGENLLSLKEEAKMMSPEELIYYIRVFSELSNQIRFGAQKRVLIEIALIKLCRPRMEENVEALFARVSQLEKQVEKGLSMAPAVATACVGSQIGNFSCRETEPAQPPENRMKESLSALPKAVPEQVHQVVKNWSSLIQNMSGSLRAFLKTARLSLGEGNQLVLVFDDELAESYVNAEAHRSELEAAIAKKTGKDIEVVVMRNESGRPFEESFVDLKEIINMDITMEDE